MQSLPPVMANARVDLAGNISGDFSPSDWESILARAAEELRQSTKPPAESWADVIRDFHRQRYWGFKPDYVKPKLARQEQNLGKRFIWYVSRSFLITKVAVLYFGARWTAGYDPINGYLFFGAMVFMLGSYGHFLWSHRHRDDEWKDPNSPP